MQVNHGEKIYDSCCEFYSSDSLTQSDSEIQSMEYQNQTIDSVKLNMEVNDDQHVNSCHCPSCLDEDTTYRYVMTSLADLLNSETPHENENETENKTQEPGKLFILSFVD